ncbi:MAG: response regulator [Candidatus Binatia bacterium]
MENEKRILLVEDEKNWQDMLHSILEEEGYEAEIALSYGEALGELRRKAFDLAVIDLRLVSSIDEENLDGMALLGDALNRRVPVIVVTGYGTPKLVEEAYGEYGVFSFLEKKNFDSSRFRELTREAIAATKEVRQVQEELTPEQKKEFRELTKRLFRGEVIDFS